MLILTEGESEKVYFDTFRGRDSHVAVVPIVAKRNDSKNLIAYCAKQADEYGIDIENGDTVSVVIDVDQRTRSELEEIEAQCAENGMELYISNISFEYWLVLHYKDLTKACSQEDLEHTLTECLKRRYVKSEGIGRKTIEKNLDSAIKRAKGRISDELGRNRLCAGLDPSTTVHFLVRKIIDGAKNQGDLK